LTTTTDTNNDTTTTKPSKQASKHTTVFVFNDEQEKANSQASYQTTIDVTLTDVVNEVTRTTQRRSGMKVYCNQ
jgi:hypothetical protein